MRVRDEIQLSFGVLLVIQVVTAFAAIALLGRMSPAIEQIIQENVFSITAVEQMLAALVERDLDPIEAQRDLEHALERAEGNITEDEERPVLLAIRRDSPQALSGDPVALERSLAEMRTLGNINRASMQRADDDAKGLGEAGAWAVAALGLLGFIGSLWVSRRLYHRIIDPLAEIYDALRAFKEGDDHRVCSVSGAPVEIQELSDTLTALFRALALRNGGNTDVAVDRAFVLWTLDRMKEPAALLDTRGDLVAANRAGADRLDADQGALRAHLRGAIASSNGELPNGVVRDDVRGVGILVRWHEAED